MWLVHHTSLACLQDVPLSDDRKVPLALSGFKSSLSSEAAAEESHPHQEKSLSLVL
jgi:hypothetical protein